MDWYRGSIDAYWSLLSSMGILSGFGEGVHRLFFGRQCLWPAGKDLIFFCSIAILFFLIPRIWAKRANLFVAAVILAFGIKCFILYTGCARGICPDKRIGIFLVLLLPMIITAATALPDIKLKNETH